MKKSKFVLYTNPNNVTSRAYTAIGAQEVKGVMRDAKEYPGSYRILYQGTGNEDDVKRVQSMFSNYQF